MKKDVLKEKVYWHSEQVLEGIAELLKENYNANKEEINSFCGTLSAGFLIAGKVVVT
jgi:hypothetical protein